MSLALCDFKSLRCEIAAIRSSGSWNPIKITNYPDLLYLAFGDFLAFWRFSRNSLLFLSVLPFFSEDFRDSEETENPFILGGFSLPFPEKARKRRAGYNSRRMIAGARRKQPKECALVWFEYPADVQADIRVDVRGQKLRWGPRNSWKTRSTFREKLKGNN